MGSEREGRPTLGRIVLYRPHGAVSAVPAIVTATQDSLEFGPELESDTEVHLTAFMPHAAPTSFSRVELDPGSDGSVYAQAPGTWRWPPRYSEAELKGGA